MRFGSFLLLPIYWRKLEPADFGIIGIAELVVVFLVPIIGLGLHDAALRFYFDWREEKRWNSITSLWLIQVGVSFMICGILDLAGERLFQTLVKSIEFHPYLRIAIWSTFAGNLTLFPFVIMRVQEKIRSYNVCLLITFAIETVLRVYFIVLLDFKAMGYLLGTLCANSVVAIYYVYFMIGRSRRPRIEREDLRACFGYSLPISATSVFEGLNGVIDRFFLDKFVPVAQIGIYTLGNQIGFAYSFINQAMKASWMPLLFRSAAERSDTPRMLATFTLYYFAALTLPGLLICLFTPNLIHLLASPKYEGVASIVPWFVLIYLAQASATGLGRGADLAKKTIPTIWPLALAVGVSVFFGWILVPQYGIYGGLASLMLSSLVRTAALAFVGIKHYPRPTPWLKMVLVLFSMLAVLILAAQVDEAKQLMSFLSKGLLFVIYLVAVCQIVIGLSEARKLADQVFAKRTR